MLRANIFLKGLSARSKYVSFELADGMGTNSEAARGLCGRQSAGLRAVRRRFLVAAGARAARRTSRGGLNIAHEAIDRHVLASRGGKLALRWIGRDDRVRDFSYAPLSAQYANRFANVFAQCGIAKGDRVFSLLGRFPELYIAAFGTLKNGSVFSPLFSAFGPEPISARMTIGNAKALVTSEALYRRKIEPWRKQLASLEHVFLTECSTASAGDGRSGRLGRGVGFV